MKYLDELATRALLGTGREAGGLPAAPDSLAELAASSSGTEGALLSAAAAAVLYDRAGRKPVRVSAGVQPCPIDARPSCSTRAVTILERLLGGGEMGLVMEWLESCAKAGKRPPRRLLPALLDAGNRRGENRSRLGEAVMRAVGEAGLWLCRMNPDWGLLVSHDESADAEQVWQTGGKAERLAALGRLRAADPGRARELLQSTFASEPAADRAAFVETLATGLSGEDEAFLESCLSDRSKEVRAAAATLLARLAESAYSKRMIARLTPLLKFAKGKLEVELPKECDEGMKRDAIEPKPPQGVGERQWWLSQMLSRVRPGHWSKAFGLPPARLMEALEKDHAALVVEAWAKAAEGSGDADWAEAIVRLGISAQQWRLGRSFLGSLPRERYLGLVYDILENGRMDSGMLNDLMNSHDVHLDDRAARALLRRVSHWAGQAPGRQDYQLGYLLPQVALRVPPALYKEFEEAWSGDAWEPYRKPLAAFFTTLQTRLHIQQEFSK
jgi:hypothetical protein